MPKPRSESSTRKPPEPLDSHKDIDDWMGRVMPDLQPIVKHFDKVISKVIPGVQYGLKWKKVYYGLPDLGWVIEMVAYDVSVNLVFHGGAEFDSPPKLGSGSSRYVKVSSLEEAKAPEVRKWIEQAATVPGWQ